MSQVNTQAALNFHSRTNWASGNTTVTTDQQGNTHLILHGHTIATLSHGNDFIIKGNLEPLQRVVKLSITNAGYFTAVTKARLNALQGVNIVQKNGVWYLNGKEWSGEWINI